MLMGLTVERIVIWGPQDSFKAGPLIHHWITNFVVKSRDLSYDRGCHEQDEPMKGS